MFLAALYELSQRENLVPDEGYVLSQCHYTMVISRQGDLLSIVLDPKKLLVPQSDTRTSGASPMFLVDNVKYVFGAGGTKRPDAKKEANRLGRLVECRRAYYDQIHHVAAMYLDEGAIAYDAFGANVSKWAKQIDLLAPETDREKYPEGWTGSEIIVCYLEGDSVPIYMRPALRECWATIRDEGEVGRIGRCILTGEMARVKMTHPKIKNLPGGQSSGTFVCCYDKEAFSAQGAQQGENACISRKGAEGYAAALNWLLERTEARKHRFGVRVGDDATMIVWTSTQSEFASDLITTLSPDPAPALALPSAPIRGMAPAPIDETRFFAAILSANASRVVVHGFIQQTVGGIKQNVQRYFDDMRIGADTLPVSLWKLHRTLQPKSIKEDFLPSVHGSPLMLAILQGTTYPYVLLDLAVSRLHDPSVDRRSIAICCGVIKAVLLRLPAYQRKELTVALDENNTTIPYLLGRLFAVMERLQEIAIPEIGASMRDKHFATAMSAPAQIYPDLVALSSHHYSKVMRMQDGRGRWLERIKTEIFSRLTPGFPSRQNTEAQGIWAVGYYHQREVLWAKKPVTAEQP